MVANGTIRNIAPVPYTRPKAAPKLKEKMEDRWAYRKWATTLALDSHYPISSYGQMGDLPINYRIKLLPRVVYCAQRAAAARGINFQKYMEAKMYQAFIDLGLSFDSAAELTCVQALAEQKDNLLHLVSVSDVYTDDPIPLETSEVPVASETEWDRKLDEMAQALTKIRSMKKYESIYAVNKPTVEDARKELELVATALPSSLKDCIYTASLSSLCTLLTNYVAICKNELSALIRLNREPLPAALRNKVIANNRKLSNKDKARAEALLECELKPLSFAQDVLSMYPSKKEDNYSVPQGRDVVRDRIAEIKELDMERRLAELERLTVVDHTLCAIDIALFPPKLRWEKTEDKKDFMKWSDSRSRKKMIARGKTANNLYPPTWFYQSPDFHIIRVISTDPHRC